MYYAYIHLKATPKLSLISFWRPKHEKPKRSDHFPAGIILPIRPGPDDYRASFGGAFACSRLK